MEQQQKDIDESRAIREDARMNATKMDMKVSQAILERLLAWYIALDPSDIEKEDEELADYIEKHAENDDTHQGVGARDVGDQLDKSCETCLWSKPKTVNSVYCNFYEKGQWANKKHKCHEWKPKEPENPNGSRESGQRSAVPTSQVHRSLPTQEKEPMETEGEE